MAYKQDFVKKVLEERLAQDRQWGGPRHDDAHTYTDWKTFIKDQLDSLLHIPGTRADLEAAMRDPHNMRDFERRMVKVAALAMAAVESSRRKAVK